MTEPAAESTHWRLMYPSEFLAAADLKGRDVSLTIKAVSVDELPMAGKSTKEKRAVIRFVEKDKKMVMNKTNARVIAKLYGVMTAAWVGKRITLYPTTTKFGPDTVECLRIREVVK